MGGGVGDFFFFLGGGFWRAVGFCWHEFLSLGCVVMGSGIWAGTGGSVPVFAEPYSLPQRSRSAAYRVEFCDPRPLPPDCECCVFSAYHRKGLCEWLLRTVLSCQVPRARGSLPFQGAESAEQLVKGVPESETNPKPASLNPTTPSWC